MSWFVAEGSPNIVCANVDGLAAGINTGSKLVSGVSLGFGESIVAFLVFNSIFSTFWRLVDGYFRAAELEYSEEVV